MIRCIVFDFDGTLVDSNRIKRDAFFTVAGGISGGDAAMRRILSEPDPGDRYAVFGRFVEIAGLAPGWQEKLARQYGDLCANQIADCPEMPGAIAAMEALHARRINLFVNSATPEADLRPIVERRCFRDLLSGVYGGPVSKAENLQSILAASKTEPREAVVVGDGANDCEAAEKIGCHFVPVFEAPGSTAGCGQLLTDLSLLPAAIERLVCGHELSSPMNSGAEASK